MKIGQISKNVNKYKTIKLNEINKKKKNKKDLE